MMPQSRTKIASLYGEPRGGTNSSSETASCESFYRVEEDQVLVDAIGRKRGNQLFIGGKRVTL
jgi:hypothetical protein